MRISFPSPRLKGGPGSFQARLVAGLEAAGHQISYSIDESKADAIFVISATRKLKQLYSQSRRGTPIVQRLDGLNWLHRRLSTRRGWRDFVYSETANWNINFVHSFLSDTVVYQSRFVESWWKRSGWRQPKSTAIVHNGVRLDEFFPKRPSAEISLVCLEGNLDYSPYSAELLNDLYVRLQGRIKLVLYGNFYYAHQKKKLNPAIDYRGVLSAEKVSDALQNSIYFSLDVNAACPNTVVEALACGSPVVGFDTGALRELVPPDAGCIVPYGGNPWKLEYPSVDQLVDSVLNIRERWDVYSQAARAIAESRYDINHVVQRYITIIEKLIADRR